jgi:hypothetical protein
VGLSFCGEGRIGSRPRPGDSPCRVSVKQIRPSRLGAFRRGAHFGVRCAI